MTVVTREYALDLLRSRIGFDTKQTDLAEEFKVSPAFMSAVLNGQKKMTKEMMASVGVCEVLWFSGIKMEPENDT